MKTTFLTFMLSTIFMTSMADPNTYTQPTPGNEFTIHKVELLESNFHPGNGGNNFSWLMDSIPASSFNISVEDASKNPFFNSFKTADIVVSNDYYGNSPNTFGNEHYHFYRMVNGQLIKLGRVDYNPITNEEQINVFSNNETKMDDLMFYGHKHSDTWEGSYMNSVTNNTVYWSDGKTTYEIDGIGTVRAGGFTLKDVFRIKRERTYVERSPSTTSIDHKIITYEWWMPNVPLPIFSFEHIVSSGSGPDQYFAYYLNTAHYLPVGTEEINVKEIEVNVFPNPATHTAYISFEMENENRVKIVLMDQTGRIVSEVLNEHLSIGNHQVEMNLDLSPGIYLVKLEANNTSSIKRLMVN